MKFRQGNLERYEKRILGRFRASILLAWTHKGIETLAQLGLNDAGSLRSIKSLSMFS